MVEQQLATRTIQDVIDHLPSPPCLIPPKPSYVSKVQGQQVVQVALAVESMKRHMTDEGWQIMAGLEKSGYHLAGHNLPLPHTDVRELLTVVDPDVLLIQDKREWDLIHLDFRDPRARFTNVEELAHRPDIFKLTILKDAHQRPDYHCQSAIEMGVHAWVVYYHPKLIQHLAPYVRAEHLIRTYHSIDSQIVPLYAAGDRRGIFLSGALLNCYPLRRALFRDIAHRPRVTAIYHPGYHRNGCCTPVYLDQLAQHKVAICTSSIYGYALRKIIEATACGCIVVTDLPADEVLPEIDDNLVRVDPTMKSSEVYNLCVGLERSYDPMRQEHFANCTQNFYYYRKTCARLCYDIEQLRRSYN